MPIELSDTSPPARHTLAPDDEVVIRLAENPTTGYRWELSQSGAGELALVDDRFVTGDAGVAPGAGGYRMFRFAARRQGEVHIEAVLRRPWEGTQASLQNRAFTVVVG